MNTLHRFAAGLAIITISSATLAQSTNTLADQRMRDGRVQAGLVIPFGSSGSKSERAPRLEMWSEQVQRAETQPLRLRDDRDSADMQRMRIGMSLTDQPRMIVNGREVPGQEDRKNVSTWGWIGIGLGVAVVVFGVVLVQAFKNAD